MSYVTPVVSVRVNGSYVRVFQAPAKGWDSADNTMALAIKMFDPFQ